MSATIGNLNELATFLDADVYNKDFRPVELKEQIKCGSDILEVRKDTTNYDEIFVPIRTVNFNVSFESADLHSRFTPVFSFSTKKMR